MTPNLTLARLARAVREDAGIRWITRLQPLGGKHHKIFPPTYPGERQTDPPQHIFEAHAQDDKIVWCTLLDSVQSQANRMEAALAEAKAEHAIPLPEIKVDFDDEKVHGPKSMSSLEASHRAYDAVFRDSLLDGVPFLESAQGRALAAATPADASAMLELCPHGLAFGAWHSQVPSGTRGAKFRRIVASEIVAIEVPTEEVTTDGHTGQTRRQSTTRRIASRIDRLGIVKEAAVYRDPKTGDWTNEETAGAEKVKPAKVGHGGVKPGADALGITCEHAEQRATVSFAAVRQLRFGGSARTAAGRNLVAALALLALAEQRTEDCALRTGCELTGEGPPQRLIIDAEGNTEAITIDRETAQTVYREAYMDAEEAGFRFASLTLKPQPKLVTLMARSRALSGAESEADDA